MKKRVSLSDIAEIVGVSKMAVSKALRDDKSIGKETKKQVEEVAKRLGYIPNRLAQGLSSGKSCTIAIIVGGSFHDSYHDQFIRGTQAYAIDRGYTVSIGLVDRERLDESTLIEKFRHMMIDGFLVFHSLDIEPYRKLQEQGVPFVFYTKYFENFPSDYVVCNDILGGYMMTKHLLELGHRKIAFVASAGLEESSEIKERLRGYRQALEEYGVPYDDRLNLSFEVAFSSDPKEANEEFVRAMRGDERPTALFVCNDITASSVYMVLKQLDLRIPEDVSVGGYEGVYLGKSIDPPLTTVETSIREMGRRACEILIDKIENRRPMDDFAQVRIDPALSVRRSTRHR